MYGDSESSYYGQYFGQDENGNYVDNEGEILEYYNGKINLKPSYDEYRQQETDQYYNPIFIDKFGNKVIIMNTKPYTITLYKFEDGKKKNKQRKKPATPEDYQNPKALFTDDEGNIYI